MEDSGTYTTIRITRDTKEKLLLLRAMLEKKCRESKTFDDVVSYAIERALEREDDD